MSKRAIVFVEEWIGDNITGQTYIHEDDDDRPDVLAERCRADAVASDIPDSEIVEEYPDLSERMATAIDAAADAEVAGLVAKDD